MFRDRVTPPRKLDCLVNLLVDIYITEGFREKGARLPGKRPENKRELNVRE